jgi:uncharacterized LabA/DUF88 family protein
MIWPTHSKLTRIAVFIDGGYFDEVSRYYKFQHARNARISLDGLQSFIRHKVAEAEKTEESYCQVVESHYFRGRFSAADAVSAGKLQDQAAFDDVLIRAGVVQHYMPIRSYRGKPQEMGIDVWLSLEAFDLAVHKRFDVLALVACDADYVPLLRKLSGIGTRSIVLAWDFQYEFTDTKGVTQKKETRTSQALIDACTYPVMMAPLIDDRSKKDDAVIKGLFVETP